ncbi:stimulated by retinoic acid gene 8 protein homolog [Callorhinchus milii]|uniref:stimulated by retinoic acid gene 8 protein homolog n=1 Tax=Callorhinchus milii TaxID=7868 RepID=UPI001C3FE148|nr:stimulated by retinoic acid gene 8 protein homolog [Callorhinchus milii]
MESSAECTSPFTDASPSFLAMLQEVEPRVARRRLSQARHRAKLAGLFNHLRDTVYSQPKRNHRTTSKWQVLRKAKHYILDLEKKLEDLLKLKAVEVKPSSRPLSCAGVAYTEANHLDDGQPSSLAGIKEQYINNLYKEQCGDLATANLPGKTKQALWQWLKGHREGFAETDGKAAYSESPGNTAADLIEFEGYLYFYKETMDLLVENVIVSVEQIGLPIVSKAISHLWQGMSAEKKAVIFKKCLSPSKAITLQLPMQMDYSLRDKMLDSQGASASSESTPDEMLFEDAFDFASGFLIKSESNAHTGIKRENSSTFTHCASENPEETCTLYKQIVNFVKAQCDAATHLLQLSLCLSTQQTGSPNFDDEAFLLRCTETFDDDL